MICMFRRHNRTSNTKKERNKERNYFEDEKSKKVLISTEIDNEPDMDTLIGQTIKRP